MTTGCLGVNTAKDMLTSYKNGIYTVQLAKLDTMSLSGYYVKRIKPALLKEINARAFNLVFFKTTGTDIKPHPSLADYLSSKEDSACGRLSNFRLGLEGTKQIITGDFTLRGPKAFIIEELLENAEQTIVFSMSSYMETSEDNSGPTAMVKEILGFHILGNYFSLPEKRTGVYRTLKAEDTFV